jgi:hypothetical protein
VSLALQELADDGLLRCTGPTEWTLSHASLDALGAVDEAVSSRPDQRADVVAPRFDARLRGPHPRASP